MPDVGRSDSQRSDSSQRPRVSFNRDVHIKRIVPPGIIPSSYNSLDRTKLRKRRTPVQQIFSDDGKTHGYDEKQNAGKRLTRSVSDVGKGSLRHKNKEKIERDDSQNRERDEKKLSIFATLDRRLRKDRKVNERTQKQLSPILEDENNKGTSNNNNNNNNPFSFKSTPKIVIEPPTPIEEKFNNSVDYPLEQGSFKRSKNKSPKKSSRRISKENTGRTSSPKSIEETEESGQDNHSVVSALDVSDSKGNDINGKRSVKETLKKNTSSSISSPNSNNVEKYLEFDERHYDSYSISSTQDKGKDVKRIVRELSKRDTKRISPPKTRINALVDPAMDVDRQHNMNRPFSYLNPNTTPTDTDQVIYAQVVCSGGDKTNDEIIKRTIHTTVDRRINTDVEEEEENEAGVLIETTNMKTNDNSILDHLAMRRDRLESRLDSHKRRFQQNILTNNNSIINNNNNNENRYIATTNDLLVENLGSISDLTTKERYFEHHIKTTASFKHKEFLSDPLPSSNSLQTSPQHTQKQKEHLINTEYDYKPQHNNNKKQDQQKHHVHHEQHHNSTSSNTNNNQDDKQKHQQQIKSQSKNKDVRKKTTKMDKVRQLVSWNKKNKSQTTSEDVDPVKARYIEYKGNEHPQENLKVAEHYATRRRVPTPVKNDSTWFKSLTRRSKQKDRKVTTPLPEEETLDYQTDRPYSSKTLRFFGDSDKESIQSSNITHLQARNSHVRPPPDSSAESTLEDESGHSQKSVVYLHAAAVGDIPGSRKLHRSQLSNGRRALSREELSSNASTTTFVPHTRTLSRSISVLAPWKPRHPRDGIEINYNDVGKPPRGPVKTTTKTPSKPEKKKQKEATLSRRGSDESKKSESVYSQESLNSRRKNHQQYNMDTVDHSNTNSLHRKVKKTNSETDLTKSTSTHGDTRTSGWFRSRK
ncbi:bloated isoform X2 [Lycorma delicatula]|uniref:bloated isoform X2 n=1 Tax=Lycorma delicatula TaxID=130591 RepID=UPI003F50F99B